ncbi:MAG: 6-phosphogluconolactonase [Acidimicrobiales bacterium]
MRHELRVFDDVDALARAAAGYAAERARRVRTRRTPFTFAVSGGKSPWLMLRELAREDVRWDHTMIYQVDERVVPADSDLRNLKHLRECLTATSAPVVPMDVDNADLDEACDEYATLIPSRFDLVHLGLGPDGHCASLVPNDPVLDVTDRLVALSGPYQDSRRMTLTYPALARADDLLWVVSGEDKRDALAKLLENDTSIPAGRVSAGSSIVLADRAAVDSSRKRNPPP